MSLISLGQFRAPCCVMAVEFCQNPSFPHAFSENPGETQTEPPIKTFGGDNFGEGYHDAFSIPPHFAEVSSFELHDIGQPSSQLAFSAR